MRLTYKLMWLASLGAVAGLIVIWASWERAEAPSMSAAQGPEPVFVHCQHGADRTGTMFAIYFDSTTSNPLRPELTR